MLPFNANLDYGLMRQHELLNQSRRELPRLGTSWQLSRLREAVDRTAEQLGAWYERQGELCLNLDPACELA